MTEPCGQPVASQQTQFDSDKPSPVSVGLILRLPKQLICLHAASLSAVLVRAREAARERVREAERGRRCVVVCVLWCASMRVSLKRSFIQKHTVQGEMRDELFRCFP